MHQTKLLRFAEPCATWRSLACLGAWSGESVPYCSKLEQLSWQGPFVAQVLAVAERERGRDKSGSILAARLPGSLSFEAQKGG